MLPKAKQAHVEAWPCSGLTKSAYCQEHGLNSKTFSRWCRLAEVAEAPVPRLLPVEIKPASSDLSAPIQLRLPAGGVLELPQSISPNWPAEWAWLIAGVEWQRLSVSPTTHLHA